MVGPAGYMLRRNGQWLKIEKGGRGLSGRCLTTTVVNLCHGPIFTANCSGHSPVCRFYFRLETAGRWKLMDRPKGRGCRREQLISKKANLCVVGEVFLLSL